ncbi:MAG: hypothetical protein ACPGWM_10440 [Flavobacteriales bacterium]
MNTLNSNEIWPPDPLYLCLFPCPNGKHSTIPKIQYFFDMNPVEDYIFNKPDHQKDVLIFLHSLALDLGLTAQMKWSLPVYFYEQKYSWYMYPLKKGGAEVVFAQSKLFGELESVLDYKKRTKMGGFEVQSVETEDLELLVELMKKAIELRSTK